MQRRTTSASAGVIPAAAFAMSTGSCITMLSSVSVTALPVNGFRPDHRTTLDELRQRFALDQLHRHEQRVAVLLDVVDRGDVRMCDRCDRARLAQEALFPLRIGGEIRGKNLDRALPQELRVFGAPHLAHPACAEAVDQSIGSELHWTGRIIDGGWRMADGGWRLRRWPRHRAQRARHSAQRYRRGTRCAPLRRTMPS